MFLSLEGLDASGKHTQSENLKRYFERLGRDVMKFDFPRYESVTGQMIKDHLKGLWTVETQLVDQDKPALYASDPGTYLFQCCQLVNRMECLPDAVWDQKATDRFHRPRIFIADRYNASAYAYGMAFGIDFDWLVKTHRHLPQPDVNIFLDIPVEESFARRPERRDNYERNAERLDRVRQCYIEVFKRLGPSYVVLNAQDSIDAVFKQILDVLWERKLV